MPVNIVLYGLFREEVFIQDAQKFTLEYYVNNVKKSITYTVTNESLVYAQEAMTKRIIEQFVYVIEKSHNIKTNNAMNETLLEVLTTPKHQSLTWIFPLIDEVGIGTVSNKNPCVDVVQKPQGINGVSVGNIAYKLPGMNTRVDLPCDCYKNGGETLRWAIIHVNDEHQWTREKIADWLDELHDAGTIDIEFDSEPIKVEYKKYSISSLYAEKPEFDYTEYSQYIKAKEKELKEKYDDNSS